MKKLHEIAQTYINAGNGKTPAAIIQHASLPNQKSVRGVIEDLPRLAEEAHLTHPSIIIIGWVADENLSY